jgi:hypothetical protein
LSYTCGFCAAQALSETPPSIQPAPEPAPPAERLLDGGKARVASIPLPKTLVANLDRIGDFDSG